MLQYSPEQYTGDKTETAVKVKNHKEDRINNHCT